MGRFIQTLMTCGVFALAAGNAAAGGGSAEDLVRKSIAARGGVEKLKAIRSVEETISANQMGADLTGRIVMKRPDQLRIELNFQGKTMIRAYDGKTAWSVVPFHGSPDPEEMPADDAKSLIEQADLDGPLVDFRSKGYRVELAGRDEVEGAPADKLKVTNGAGDVSYVYLDAETGLRVRQSSKRRQQGSEVDVDTYLTNYKPVEGVFFPFSIETRIQGKPAGRVVVHDIKLNLALDDAIFAMPGR